MDQSDDKRIHVLIIDDDSRLQANVRDFLEPYDIKVSSVFSSKHVPAVIDELNPDIVLLDVMLPGEDGFTTLQRLRAHSRIPVIMLTARGDDADRIVGLELGADDYLAKPFNPRELLARIKAVLRRVPEPKSEHDQDNPDAITLDSVTLDIKRQRLVHGEQAYLLSTTEFRIVHAFMSHPDTVLSRDQILNLAFGKDYYANDRNIDVYISRIRSILRKIGENPAVIQTVWGSGYRWAKEY